MQEQESRVQAKVQATKRSKEVVKDARNSEAVRAQALVSTKAAARIDARIRQKAIEAAEGALQDRVTVDMSKT